MHAHANATCGTKRRTQQNLRAFAERGDGRRAQRRGKALSRGCQHRGHGHLGRGLCQDKTITCRHLHSRTAPRLPGPAAYGPAKQLCPPLCTGRDAHSAGPSGGSLSARTRRGQGQKGLFVESARENRVAWQRLAHVAYDIPRRIARNSRRRRHAALTRRQHGQARCACSS